MKYDQRIKALMDERNSIHAQIAQPLAQMTFIDGQIKVLMDLRAEDEAALKQAQEAARKTAEPPSDQIGEDGHEPGVSHPKEEAHP